MIMGVAFPILGVSWVKEYLSSLHGLGHAARAHRVLWNASKLELLWNASTPGCVCRTAVPGLIPTLFSPFILGCFPEVQLQASQFLCSRKRTISLSSFSQAAFSSLLPSVWVCLGWCWGIPGSRVLRLFGFGFESQVNFSLSDWSVCLWTKSQ